MRSTEQEYEERIGRFLELAASAQDAADRAFSLDLREIYLRLAGQWADLAALATSLMRTKAELETPVSG